MISGGLEFKPVDAIDTDKNSQFNTTELNRGLDGTAPTVGTTQVTFEGEVYDWQDIKKAAEEAAKAQQNSGSMKAGDNFDPKEFKIQLLKLLTPKIQTKATEVEDLKRKIQALQANIASTTNAADKRALETQLATARSDVADKQTALQKLLNQARPAGSLDASLKSRADQAMRSPPNTTGTGTGHFSASIAPGATTGGGAGPTGGAPNTGSPYRAMGAGPSGADLFSGMNAAPSTASFLSAMHMDNYLSDGFEGALRSRAEGQKLMMLFFYFARMAESGDLGAMYQFIKFITYIISKDKARQNIQISTKLIQLQEASRKATEALMKAPTDDQSAFAKVMQETRGQEAAISTSQKLLADMLQEFAHVVETLTNSVKNLLNAWGRVQRTASSR